MRRFETILLMPIARTATPEWLTTAIVIAAILLAILAVALMFRRVDMSRAGMDSTMAETQRRYPEVYYDPVLVISAIGVVGLAIAAWLLR